MRSAIRNQNQTIASRANCRNWLYQVNHQFQKFSPFFRSPGVPGNRTALPDGPAGVDCSSVGMGFPLEKTWINSESLPKLSERPVGYPPPATRRSHRIAFTKGRKRRNSSVSASNTPVCGDRPTQLRMHRMSGLVGMDRPRHAGHHEPATCEPPQASWSQPRLPIQPKIKRKRCRVGEQGIHSGWVRRMRPGARSGVLHGERFDEIDNDPGDPALAAA